jgi:N-acyl-D-amino-acid deacylase
MFVPQDFRNEAGSNFGAMLGDSTFVRRIIDDLDPRFVDMLEQGIATDMYVSGDGQDGRYVGMTVGQVAEKMALPVAHAAIQMLADAGESYGAVMVNERWADWEDIQAALSDPNWLLMGDGSMANLDGPLANQGMALADWGWATVTLGRFVRELGVLTLEDAIRRMTSGPAAQIGLATRGEVREGFAADLVLFDANTVGSDVRPEG